MPEDRPVNAGLVCHGNSGCCHMAAGDVDCALRTDGSPGRNIAFSNVQPKNLLCVLSFLAVCAGMLVFLNRFTQSESAFLYPAWETGGVVSPDGKETAFDPAGQPPPLAEGETYRYTLTLPQGRANGSFLIFETAGLEVSAYLGDTELWRSAADQSPETVNQSQAQIALPAGRIPGPIPPVPGIPAPGGGVERHAVLADLVAGAGVRRPFRLGTGTVYCSQWAYSFSSHTILFCS